MASETWNAAGSRRIMALFRGRRTGGQNLPSHTCKSTREIKLTNGASCSVTTVRSRKQHRAVPGGCAASGAVGSAGSAGGLHLLWHSRPRAKPRTNTEPMEPAAARLPRSRLPHHSVVDLLLFVLFFFLQPFLLFVVVLVPALVRLFRIRLFVFVFLLLFRSFLLAPLLPPIGFQGLL